jgi:sugar/nucleoside kinase (ribokinase family)
MVIGQRITDNYELALHSNRVSQLRHVGYLMSILNKCIGVVGSTTLDDIVSPNGTISKIGGATTYAGITYRRHAIDVFIISNVAPDDRIITDRLEQENIIVFNGESDRTTHFINTIKNNSRRQEVFNRSRPILHRQLLRAVKYVGAWHLSPLHPDDIEPKVLTELPHTDLKIYLDVQGYTRKVENNAVLPAVSSLLPAALSAAHIIKANGAEIRLILEHFQKDLPEIMESFEIEEAVITLGREGGWVQTRDGLKINYTANRLETVADPTGAGDVFFAAYLLSRFIKNRGIADACQYAAGIAARQVEGTYISLDRLVLP